MSTFDNFLNMAKEVADAAAQKTGEALEVSKLKLQEMRVSNNIRKAYCELGSLYYNMVKFGGGNNEQISLCIAEIDKLIEEQEALEKSAGQAAGKRKCYCAACGSENALSSAYCAKCGSPLAGDVVNGSSVEE